MRRSTSQKIRLLLSALLVVVRTAAALVAHPGYPFIHNNDTDDRGFDGPVDEHIYHILERHSQHRELLPGRYLEVVLRADGAHAAKPLARASLDNHALQPQPDV
jgi:hypothetical protein